VVTELLKIKERSFKRVGLGGSGKQREHLPLSSAFKTYARLQNGSSARTPA
jgi:hypothetical protein